MIDGNLDDVWVVTGSLRKVQIIDRENEDKYENNVAQFFSLMQLIYEKHHQAYLFRIYFKGINICDRFWSN